jgi:hypothetical protein
MMPPVFGECFTVWRNRKMLEFLPFAEVNREFWGHSAEF